MTLPNAVLLLRALLVVVFFGASSLRVEATTVTVVTHGLNSNADDWVMDMSKTIAQYQRDRGMDCDVYSVNYPLQNFVSAEPQFEIVQRTSSSTNPAKNLVIAFDWRDYATSVAIILSKHSNKEVGPSLVGFLTKRSAIPGLLETPLAANTLHLIGHSRGGSLMCGVSVLLRDAGYYVDQLTTLDPKPWGPLLAPDYPTNVGGWVCFADNYYQTFDWPADGNDLLGAYSRRLMPYNSYDPMGWPQVLNGHESVHKWYQYTISGIPWAQIQPQYWDLYRQWFEKSEEEGAKAGYYLAWCPYGVRPTDGFASRRVGNPKLICRFSPTGDVVTGWDAGPTGTFKLETSTNLVTWTAKEGTVYLDGKEFRDVDTRSEVAEEDSTFYRMVPAD